MANCRGCGAEIIWFKTKNDKSMPCDANKVTIITENGETVTGYIPHWTTCPKYKQFKKESQNGKQNNN